MSEMDKDSSRSADQIENGHGPDAGINKEGVAKGYSDPSYVDHREGDDRADEAKGRNADKYDKKYWLSVNYIGTLFAIGMAFMGGIGGMFRLHSSVCMKQILTIAQGTV